MSRWSFSKRRKLHDKFGGDVVDIRGPMPAHLLSDMWGRWADLPSFVFRISPFVFYPSYSSFLSPTHAFIFSGRFWNNLYQFVEPFSGKPAIDPTEAMKKQNYTVRKMFQVLLKLMNMEKMTLFLRRGTTSMQRWACTESPTLSGNSQCWRNQRIERWLPSLQFAFHKMFGFEGDSLEFAFSQ